MLALKLHGVVQYLQPRREGQRMVRLRQHAVLQQIFWTKNRIYIACVLQQVLDAAFTVSRGQRTLAYPSYFQLAFLP